MSTIQTIDNQPSVQVLGSSLVAGAGASLRLRGIKAHAISYHGAELPALTKTVETSIDKDSPPDVLCLLGGGNDCCNQPIEEVKKRYCDLINEARRVCPESQIITIGVPPRRRSPVVSRRIVELNDALKDLAEANPTSGITYLDACPKVGNFYKRDRVHFNKTGVEYLTRNIAAAVRNFHVLEHSTRL